MMRKYIYFYGLLLVLSLMAGCSSSPKTITDKEMVYSNYKIISEIDGAQLSLRAMTLVGTPYRYGGNSPETGFDCSGFIGYVLKKQLNIVAPRTTSQLAQWGVPTQLENLRSGDLVVFGREAVPSHVGFYVGEGKFIHAPSKNGVVKLDRIGAKHWVKLNPRYRRPVRL